MRVIAAGGGEADDSRLLDEVFAGWLGSTGKLLYLPVAMDESDSSYQDCMAWLCSVFNPMGVSDIKLCTNLKWCNDLDLDGYDGVYIGGGNTYRLLWLMRSSGFDRALARFTRAGGAVYGGSAGAIILGREISACAHMDENRVGLERLDGLNLLCGYSVWCHYQPEDHQRITTYIQRTGFPVLALSEKSGACLERDQLRACGFEPVQVYDTRSNNRIYPGEVIPSNPCLSD